MRFLPFLALLASSPAFAWSFSTHHHHHHSHGTHFLHPDGDRDGDGLTNATEATLGTSPYRADTDRDGDTDYEEYVYGSDPLDSADGIDDDGD